MVGTENDYPSVILALQPGEGLGYEIRGQEMVRDGEAADLLGQRLPRQLPMVARNTVRLEKKGGKASFPGG